MGLAGQTKYMNIYIYVCGAEGGKLRAPLLYMKLCRCMYTDVMIVTEYNLWCILLDRRFLASAVPENGCTLLHREGQS